MGRAAHRALGYLVGLALLGSFTWGGGTQPAALRALMLLAPVTLAAAWLASARLGPLQLSAPTCFIGFCLLASLITLLPIPSSLYASLQPAPAALRAQVLGEVPGWRPITDDLGATLLCAGRLAALLCLGVAMTSLARSPRRPLPILTLSVLAAAVSLAALSLVGVELPAPLYAPRATRMWVRGPLQNPNHLGALLTMILPLGWALFGRAKGPRRIGLGVLLLAANLLVWGTRSRGALIGAVVGQLAAVVWLTGPRGSGRGTAAPRRLAGLMVILLGAAGLVAEGMQRGPLLAPSADSRLGTWRDSLALLREHATFGVGPGSFALVFPRYGSEAGRLRHAFVENGYLQLFLDHGIPVAAALLVLAGVLAWRSRPGEDEARSISRAALIGLGVLALHESADFASWGGAVAVAAVALACLPSPRTGWRLPPLAIILIALSPLVLAAASLARLTPDEDALGLARALELERDAVRIDALGRMAQLRHPEDAEMALTTAARLAALSAPSAASWIERALHLSPNDPRAHALAAGELARAGQLAQAAGELAAAARNASQPDRLFLIRTTTRLLTDRADLLARAIPPGAASYATDLVSELRRQKRGAEARTVLDELLQRRLDGEGLSSAYQPLLRQRIEIGLGMEEDTKLDRWLEALEALQMPPADRLLVARGWARARNPARAEAQLRAVLTSGQEGERVPAAIELSRQLGARGADAEARELVESERARAVEAASKSLLLYRIAELDEKAGRSARAAVERAEAAQLAR